MRGISQQLKKKKKEKKRDKPAGWGVTPHIHERKGAAWADSRKRVITHHL